MKDDLREMADFAIAIGNFLGVVFEDGKLSISDLGSLISAAPGLVTTASAAFEGKENIKIADIVKDKAVRDELNQYLKDGFDLPNDVAEAKLEGFFEAVFAIIAFVGVLKQ